VARIAKRHAPHRSEAQRPLVSLSSM
jgi:hypothetical protein